MKTSSFYAIVAGLVISTSAAEAKNFTVQLSGSGSKKSSAQFASINKSIAKILESSDKAKFVTNQPGTPSAWDLLVTTRLLPIPSADGTEILGYTFSASVLVDAAAGAETEQKAQIFRDLKQMALPRADSFSPEQLAYYATDTMGVVSSDFDFENDQSKLSPARMIATLVEEQAQSLEKMAEWAKRNIGNDPKGTK